VALAAALGAGGAIVDVAGKGKPARIDDHDDRGRVPADLYIVIDVSPMTASTRPAPTEPPEGPSGSPGSTPGQPVQVTAVAERGGNKPNEREPTVHHAAVKYGNLAKTFIPSNPDSVALIASACDEAMQGIKEQLPDLFLAEEELQDRAVLARHLPTIARSFASILEDAPEFLQHSIAARLRVERPDEAEDELHSMLLAQCLKSKASLREADQRTRKRRRT